MTRGPTLAWMLGMALAVLSGGLHAVLASGTGGTISLGTVSGTGSTRNVSVVTGAATTPWSGYNIHIATALGGGLTLNSITDVNGSLLTGSPFCFDNDPAVGQRILGCASIVGTPPSIVAAGTMSVFTFNTTGNGCLAVRLIAVPDSVIGYATTDTYTIDRTTTTPQTNAVNTAPTNVLVGTGQPGDCPRSVGGIAERPDVTALPSPVTSSTRTHTNYIFGTAVALFVVASGAAGWRRRGR